MNVLTMIAPPYLAIGIAWSITAWRSGLERFHIKGGRPIPQLALLLIGVQLFVVVIATWPYAALRIGWNKARRFISPTAGFVYTVLRHDKNLRRLMVAVVVLAAANIIVQIVFRYNTVLDTAEGWAFSAVVAFMAYAIGISRTGIVGRVTVAVETKDGIPVSVRLVEADPNIRIVQSDHGPGCGCPTDDN